MFEEIFDATIRDLERKQRSIHRLFPTFQDRVKQVGVKGGVRLKGEDENSWHFKLHSGTEDGLWYDATLHFKDVENVLSKLVQDKRLWNTKKTHVDLRKLSKEFSKKVNIQLSCNCKAFDFWGPNYLLSLPRYDAKYGEKETRPPKIRNPKQYGILCKHLQALFKVLPFYTTTIARWLKQFHLKTIARLERESTGEQVGIEKAGKELEKSRKTTKAKKEKEPSSLSLRKRGGVSKVNKEEPEEE